MAIDSFDFGAITKALGSNPFETNSKASYTDERFYTLPKNADGSGSAIIALLPDSKMMPIIKLLKIDTTIERNGQKRWLNTYSPKSIGLPCPFSETYLKYYNEDKDNAKRFKPKTKYICNIKIIKDSLKPENEGKVFLYEMSQTLYDKIVNMVTVTDEQKAMGITPKEIFNPLRGWVFNLRCKKKDNGIIGYDTSEFIQLAEGKCIYGTVNEEAEAKCRKDIETAHSLSDLKDPKNFKSYEELTEELNKICRGLFGIGGTPTTETKPVEEVKIENVSIEAPKANDVPVASPAKDSLDDLLNSL